MGWASGLASWAIPEGLIEQAGVSPYGWPVGFWKKRRSQPEQLSHTPTWIHLVQGVPPGGSVLDVGAGTGRVSIPLVKAGFRVTAVEKNEGMAQGLVEEADRFGVALNIIVGSWPEVAEQVEVHDGVVSTHVVYDVPFIEGFLCAMEDRARRVVVLELPPHHPWSNLIPFYRELHGWERPLGPGVSELLEVITELRGELPWVEEWTQDTIVWFDSWEELLETYQRRLVVPDDRLDELRILLEPKVTQTGDRFYFGEPTWPLHTIWWKP